MKARPTTTTVEYRARDIERIVCEEYFDDDPDAADLALDELNRDATRTNEQIAHAVAQRILQP